jgi:hypothetical protein
MFKFQIPNFPPAGDLRGASNSKCSNVQIPKQEQEWRSILEFGIS